MMIYFAEAFCETGCHELNIIMGFGLFMWVLIFAALLALPFAIKRYFKLKKQEVDQKENEIATNTSKAAVWQYPADHTDNDRNKPRVDNNNKSNPAS